MNTTCNKTILPPACAAAIIHVQRANHQTSRFEELANLPLKENRRTKVTAQTVRDKLQAQQFAAAIRLPTTPPNEGGGSCGLRHTSERDSVLSARSHPPGSQYRRLKNEI